MMDQSIEGMKEEIKTPIQAENSQYFSEVKMSAIIFTTTITN